MHPRRSPLRIVLSVVILVVLSATATAQSQLVPLVTDKTPLALSDRFGYPYDDAVNQSGDFAFVGNMGTAVFLQRAGSSVRVRLLQMGDEVPGFAGSKADVIQSPRINSAGLVAFKVDFALSDGQLQGAIFTWNGTALQKVVSGNDFVPGSTTVKYERAISLVGLNDAGDIAFTAPLVESGSPLPVQTTLFIGKAAGPFVRVAGLLDVAPDSSGRQFQSLSPVSLNNSSEVLFSAGLGGSDSGLYVGSASGVRKIVASGDAYPNPLPGTFVAPFTGLLNNGGTVVFSEEPEEAVAIWRASAGGGPPSRLVVQHTSAPVDVSGAKFGPPVLRALNDSGTFAFTSRIHGTSDLVTGGLFRYRASTGVEAVAYEGQATGWTPVGFPVPSSFVFSGIFGAVSINDAGDIAFRAQAWDRDKISIPNKNGGNRRYAIYRQSATDGTRTLVAHDGQATQLAGGGAYALGFTTETAFLDDRVWFFADVAGGQADFGYFLASTGTTETLMTTADPLPGDARVVLRTVRAGGRGDYVGFIALRAGGGLSVGAQEISTLTTKLLITDGQEVDSGVRVRVNTRNTVFLNSKGTVALVATLMDAVEARSYNVVGLRRWTGETFGIAGTGDGAPGTGAGTPEDPLKPFTNVFLNSAGPSPLNEADQVVLVGTYLQWHSTTDLNGIWVGSPGTNPTKVALNGESVRPGPDGAANGIYGNFNPVINGISLNDAGQVAFLANTTRFSLAPETRPGLYLWSSGNSAPTEIARTDWTGLTSFGFSSLNNNGDLAVIASPGAGSTPAGIYVIPYGGSPALVAGHGAGAPGTAEILNPGNYSFTVARPEVVIGDQGDVVFRSDLTSGSSDSGYFVRRSGSALKAILLQGQTAPGTTVPFAYVPPAANNRLNDTIQLGPEGDVALMAAVTDGVRKTGLWHLTKEDALESIVMRGVVAPQFGGGSAISHSPGLAWNSGSRFPLWARVSGGTFTDGIFLSVPYVPTPTPPSPVPIIVQPTDQTTGTTPVSLTFDEVTGAGETTVTTSAAGPSTPSAFTLADTPVFYDISTTAAFTGPIEVCIDISSMTFPGGGTPRLLHFENGAWVDVTSSVSTTRICGSVTALSPFTVAQIPEMTFDVGVTPAVLWPANNKMVGVTAAIIASQAEAPAQPRVELVSITSNEPLQAGDIQGAVFGSDDRSFLLRAKRLGTGSGRTYTITYRATDFVGTAAIRTATVFVPHDRRSK